YQETTRYRVEALQSSEIVMASFSLDSMHNKNMYADITCIFRERERERHEYIYHVEKTPLVPVREIRSGHRSPNDLNLNLYSLRLGPQKRNTQRIRKEQGSYLYIFFIFSNYNIQEQRSTEAPSTDWINKQDLTCFQTTFLHFYNGFTSLFFSFMLKDSFHDILSCHITHYMFFFKRLKKKKERKKC
ncbi:hypothetical protein ACJX0J_036476, partial [Zea mays]